MSATVVFPMAGDGQRFGGTFKPFLRIGGERFIEAAAAPFIDRIPSVGGLVFVVRADHDAEFSAATELERIFAGVPHQVVVLPGPTAGPLATVQGALDFLPSDLPVIACDCDHALDVSAIVGIAATHPGAAAAVPVWPVTVDEVASWSVAALDFSGRVLQVREKAWPTVPSATRAGVIGCYWLRDPGLIAGRPETGFADLLEVLVARGDEVASVRPAWAEFFGDPARLAEAERGRAAAGTGGHPL
ncbi:MAG: NTP transferase domain-containing protein [Actinomycetota bacterium]|nr:NTP transferase domain-containing protein [Actinomycetota bacterium]